MPTSTPELSPGLLLLLLLPGLADAVGVGPIDWGPVQAEYAASALPPAPSPTNGTFFAGSFSDWAVLQKGASKVSTRGQGRQGPGL